MGSQSAKRQDPPGLEEACTRLEAATEAMSLRIREMEGRLDRSDTAAEHLDKALADLDSLLGNPDG